MKPQKLWWIGKGQGKERNRGADLLAIHAAEIIDAMQEFTEVTFRSSEQQKDTSETRMHRAMKDIESLLSFSEVRDPFSDDCSLCNLLHGL